MRSWPNALRLAVIAAAVVASVATTKVSRPRGPTVVQGACGGVRVDLVGWDAELFELEVIVDPRACSPAAVHALARLATCELAPVESPVIADGRARVRFARIPVDARASVGIQLDDVVAVQISAHAGAIEAATSIPLFHPASGSSTSPTCTDALLRASGDGP